MKILVVLLLLFAAPSFLGADDSLESLEAEIKQKQGQRRARILETIQAAASSPEKAVEFYKKCVEDHDFKANNAPNANFKLWQKNFDSEVKARHLDLGLMYALQFQFLQIKTGMVGKDKTQREDILSQWLGWMGRVAGDAKSLNDCQDVLLGFSAKGPVGKALALPEEFGGMVLGVSPLQLEMIFESRVMPLVPQEKLEAVWKERIRVNSIVAHEMMKPEEWNRYALFSVPQMQANAWLALMKDGPESEKSRAATGMTNHITRFKDHPRALDWLTALKSLQDSKPTPSK